MNKKRYATPKMEVLQFPCEANLLQGSLDLPDNIDALCDDCDEDDPYIGGEIN